jgi:hypothetical protein
MNAIVKAQPGREPNNESHALMRMIEQAVERDDFDVEKLKALLAVKKEWEENEARKAFVAAMAAFKAEPIVIEKTKLVTMKLKDKDGKPAGQLQFRHTELAEVVDEVVPAMARHGLSHRWDITQAGSIITVDCVVTHALGHSQKTTMHGMPDDSGRKNLIQQVASTVTYLQRYTLMAACGVAAKGIDNDGRGAGSDDDPERSAAEIEADRKAEANRQGWLDAFESCVDLHELTARRKELADACGGDKKIPKDLMTAYSAKRATLAKGAAK